MNTRKYPRSTQEAFPNTPEYACALEVPPKPQSKALLAVCLWLVLFTLISVR
jgi:hypothetical protein